MFLSCKGLRIGWPLSPRIMELLEEAAMREGLDRVRPWALTRRLKVYDFTYLLMPFDCYTSLVPHESV